MANGDAAKRKKITQDLKAMGVEPIPNYTERVRGKSVRSLAKPIPNYTGKLGSRSVRSVIKPIPNFTTKSKTKKKSSRPKGV